MKKIAMVTGATSGIGRATAIQLADAGYNLIITGRRADRLEELKKLLNVTYKSDVVALNFDVRNNVEVKEAIDSLKGEWRNIDVLVNNAGLAVGLDPLNEGIIDDWERMIDTNVKGLLYVSRAVTPLMCERNHGHIVNICSTAGKEVYANGNVYCATKHAVDAISKGMRIDMLKYGIKVTNICPGAVETEFSLVRFKDDKERADRTYAGYKPLTGDDIATLIRFAVTLPENICINDLVVTPKAQANATNIFRVENK
ncbi:MAG: SDR family NAD(P)-dependent oxidoreductase [Paludibacteraceae bacterium]|nr:SDR family NAD(P)-dependent oxidoreductase [Paludibacteraceae bacterium]